VRELPYAATLQELTEAAYRRYLEAGGSHKMRPYVWFYIQRAIEAGAAFGVVEWDGKTVTPVGERV